MRSIAVEVCGGIASGKTSFSKAMIDAGFFAGLENFSENPFLSAFYTDPIRHAFETEITFLLQHYHIRKLGATGDCRAVYDFSLAQDLAYAMVTLGVADLITFRSVHQATLDKVGPPSLVVRLRCSPSVERKRIHVRGRPQEQGLDLGYLCRLEEAIDVALAEQPYHDVPVMELNSEAINFATDPAGIDEARARLRAQLRL